MSYLRTSKNNESQFSHETERRTFRYFNVMYGLALTTVALVSIISNQLVQDLIAQQNNDSKIINIAGRQRMLSQKIAKIALQIQSCAQTDAQLELRQANLEWTSYHQALKIRDTSKGLSGRNSPEISKSFDNLQGYFDSISHLANQICSSATTHYNDSLPHWQQQILQLEPYFLAGMDHIVNTYANEASAKQNKLKYIENSLLLVVIVVLSLEAIFIFYPLGRRIKRVIYTLRLSKIHANSLAEELQEANESLLRTNKDIRDISYALDAATIMVKTDSQGHITYANDHYCTVTKYTPTELIGHRLFENRITGEESIIYNHIGQNQQANKIWQGEIYDHAKDRTFFWLDVTLMPIVSMDGQLYQYLAICSNITKRKETELKLQAYNDQRLLKQQNEQKIRSQSIIDGQESERKRMAQEVHDGVGQMLTALKFGLESLSHDQPKEQQKIDSLKQLLTNTIRETRRISSNLLPVVLRDYGLEPAIRELCSPRWNTGNIPIEYTQNLELPQRLHTNIEISLYRICQECINNAYKYSQASQIRVRLTKTIEHIILTIDDNGQGFDTSTLKTQGNGLNNIRERAALINASLYINSRPGQGTQIFLELPIENDIYTQHNADNH
ncbi:MAG: two-component sensor histidine kinase [Bacteroidota bacterium]|jgi:PAS domain S-box-containing protein